jgi:hypothetical protein
MKTIEITALQTPDGSGLIFTFDCNDAGQIRCSDLVEQGVAADEYAAAEMLDAAPCDIRYGWVTPGANAVSAFDAAIKTFPPWSPHAAASGERQ